MDRKTGKRMKCEKKLRLQVEEVGDKKGLGVGIRWSRKKHVAQWWWVVGERVGKREGN